VVRPTSEPHDVAGRQGGQRLGIRTSARCSSQVQSEDAQAGRISGPKFKDKAPTGLLSIEFDRDGKIWFDSMYQGSLAGSIPRAARSPITRWPPEYNDDNRAVEFHGAPPRRRRQGLDQDRGTQHIFRLDLATNKWERFHPTDYLPADKVKGASIYQVISDSKNNL